MDPDHIGILGGIMALTGIGITKASLLTPEQRLRMRQERDGEQQALAIERRAASPDAAAAQAKRLRKREKLLRMERPRASHQGGKL